MVTYRSISIELRSQYGLQVIPEYLPTDSLAAESPTIAYIPIYPCSQFWIYYTISPPVPPSTYFFFKLLINGAHIVSWGCGKEENYHGKTQYALYENVNIERRWKGNLFKSEKRFFFFSPGTSSGNDSVDAANDRVVEIKVYRSHGRKRIEKSVERFERSQAGKIDLKGINLVYAGTYERHRAQKYYNYFLVDPVDQPFATFRYLYRSWDELCELGVVDAFTGTSPSNAANLTTSRSVSPVQSVGKFVEDCYAWGDSALRQDQIPPRKASLKGKSRLSFPPSIILTPGGQKFKESEFITRGEDSELAQYVPEPLRVKHRLQGLLPVAMKTRSFASSSEANSGKKRQSKTGNGATASGD